MGFSVRIHSATGTHHRTLAMRLVDQSSVLRTNYPEMNGGNWERRIGYQHRKCPALRDQ